MGELEEGDAGGLKVGVLAGVDVGETPKEDLFGFVELPPLPKEEENPEDESLLVCKP